MKCRSVLLGHVPLRSWGDGLISDSARVSRAALEEHHCFQFTQRRILVGLLIILCILWAKLSCCRGSHMESKGRNGVCGRLCKAEAERLPRCDGRVGVSMSHQTPLVGPKVVRVLASQLRSGSDIVLRHHHLRRLPRESPGDYSEDGRISEFLLFPRCAHHLHLWFAPVFIKIVDCLLSTVPLSPHRPWSTCHIAFTPPDPSFPAFPPRYFITSTRHALGRFSSSSGSASHSP